MSAPSWDREGADWPLRAHSRFVDAAGLNWHVQQLDSAAGGDAPHLLLLHGTGSATHSWRDLAPALAADFQVTALDLPGHGFTSGRLASGMTLPGVARATARLISTLEVKPALVIGHSAGAAIAVQMALDKALLSSDEATGTVPIIGLNPALMPFPGLASKLFPALAKALFVNPFAASIFARYAQIPGEVERFLGNSTGSEISAEGADYYQRLFATSRHCQGALAMMADWNLDALHRSLPKLNQPALLLHGGKDSAIPASAVRDAANLLPQGKMETLEGLGHLGHEENPERVAEAIRTWWNRVRPPVGTLVG